MKKDRFVAFFDAVMAIIMTIVVLEFAIPNGAEWHDLDTFWSQLLAYFISFFWLGIMWINLHGVWGHVEIISRPILFINLFTLFFSSMIPFFTVYVGRNLGERLPQILFGVDVMCIIICNFISTELLARKNEELKERMSRLRVSVVVDELIKIVGILIGIFFFPQAVMISVFISAVLFAVVFSIRKKRIKKKCKEIEEKK